MKYFVFASLVTIGLTSCSDCCVNEASVPVQVDTTVAVVDTLQADTTAVDTAAVDSL